MTRVIACDAMALFITGYEMDNNTFDYGVEYVTLISGKNKQKE